MDEQTFIDLICQSMQDSAQEVRRSLGRMPSATTREQALNQVAFLLNAKQATPTSTICSMWTSRYQSRDRWVSDSQRFSWQWWWDGSKLYWRTLVSWRYAPCERFHWPAIWQTDLYWLYRKVYKERLNRGISSSPIFSSISPETIVPLWLRITFRFRPLIRHSMPRPLSISRQLNCRYSSLFFRNFLRISLQNPLSRTIVALKFADLKIL